MTLALSLTAAAVSLPAAAQPAGPADAALTTPSGSAAAAPAAPAATAPSRPPAKPRNDVIRDVPVDETDASYRYDLLPYHDFPQALRALQESDRVSVEVLGQSVQGRDLHLVVITDLDDEGWDEWQRLSDLRTEDPLAAIEAFEDGEYDDWRLPVFINNTIHGNEWEGTDYFLEYAEHLAFSDDPEVLETLENQLIVGIVSQNPDGRVIGTRANANGYDLNRDYVAQTQPETLIARDQIIRYNPVSLLDTHGYVANTLILPSTGPHGQNYEIDLYIKHSLRAAEAMEVEVLALDEPRAIHQSGRIRIPYRDNADGWGPYPPIYTPMYAMQHGGHGHTIEVPLNPRGNNLSEEERAERVRINLAVGYATLVGNQRYLLAEREEVLADQLEFYRRGVAGEPGREITDPHSLEQAASGQFEHPYAVDEDGDPLIVEHSNADVYVNEYPRAWVIPFGEGQRSDTAALVTARYLLDNDVQVHRATEEVTIDGETYGPGTFVVDQHQAKRNVAQNALETGRNLSDDWRTTYADDAFSPGALYGATRVEVWDAELDHGGLTVIDDVTVDGDVPADAARFGFTVDSAAGVQAVNALLAEGVELSRLHDGTFVVPLEAAVQVQEIAGTLGVDFSALSDLRVRDAEPFDTLTIGFNGSVTQRDALLHLGFELEPVTHEALNLGEVSFDDLDALFVGGNGFTASSLSRPAADAFELWLEDGHPVLTQGNPGAAFNVDASLLPIEVADGAAGDGIAAVVNDPDSKVTGDAPDITFVNRPRWVTNAEEVDGLQVDQRIADGPDHFLAGHWHNYRAGAGQVLVVSGEARGTQVTYFASDPTFRAHTQGLFPQVAEALWPALPEHEPQDPIADAGGPYEVELGEELTLDATGSVSPDDLELTHTWDLTAVGGAEVVGETVTIEPAAAGAFEVSVTVTDTNDPPLSDTATAMVTVTEPDDPGPGPGPGPGEPDPVRFTDVIDGPHADNIGRVAGYGIALGKGDGTYDPSGTVRRDQLASFLHRLLQVTGTELPSNAPDAFDDDDGGVHEAAINDLAVLGIVQGRGGRVFDPSGNVTRDQLASFLVRTLEIVLDRELTASRSPFTDTAGSPHAANIDVAHDLGITLGRTATTFEPRASVRRDQTASFIARSLDVLSGEGVELTPLS